jgi:hypothetical protein
MLDLSKEKFPNPAQSPFTKKKRKHLKLKKPTPKRGRLWHDEDKLILQSHFDSSSNQLALDGGSVPHGYPCFTLSVTCPIPSAPAITFRCKAQYRTGLEL